ncbi:hypothetical protein SDC9_199442 [bioreactor metagenome]|uniref:HTH cro/C1-type domain-containing protein n=1 Tax=bioreactor metagenome TaxID=1076179 RepID=A0A645IX74_9ZZZZ
MISDNLKKYREEKGLSMNALARMAAVSPSYIHDIEHGKKLNPSQDVMMRLADALGISIEVLIYGKEVEEQEIGDLELYLSRIRSLSQKSQDRIKSIIEAFLEETQD